MSVIDALNRYLHKFCIESNTIKVEVNLWLNL